MALSVGRPPISANCVLVTASDGTVVANANQDVIWGFSAAALVWR
jgi:hypothetical protein